MLLDLLSKINSATDFFPPSRAIHRAPHEPVNNTWYYSIIIPSTLCKTNHKQEQDKTNIDIIILLPTKNNKI